MRYVKEPVAQPFRVEVWDSDDPMVDELMAVAKNVILGEVAYWEAVKIRPGRILSRSRSLFVIARNSSFQYRDKAFDVRRIARDLGVRYVVEGSVRKMGSRIRITAQLIDAVAGNQLWSERFDRGIDELFDVQDELTRTIVATVAGPTRGRGDQGGRCQAHRQPAGL